MKWIYQLAFQFWPHLRPMERTSTQDSITLDAKRSSVHLLFIGIFCNFLVSLAYLISNSFAGYRSKSSIFWPCQFTKLIIFSWSRLMHIICHVLLDPSKNLMAHLKIIISVLMTISNQGYNFNYNIDNYNGMCNQKRSFSFKIIPPPRTLLVFQPSISSLSSVVRSKCVKYTFLNYLNSKLPTFVYG